MLAYWLSWAHPKYAKIHPANHRIANKFLKRIINEKIQPTDEDLRNLKILKQFKNIDVAVKLGDAAFIIIEDKVNTREHGKQLDRYRQTVLNEKKTDGVNWEENDIILVYLKTGNESKAHYPKSNHVEIISRPDLLGIIEPEIAEADEIFKQYFGHLKLQQEQTDRYETIPVTDWEWPAVQGFFMKLEAHLLEKNFMKDYGGWSYVPNQTGGFLCFYWYEKKIPEYRCHIYLQLDGKDKMQVRVSGAWDEAEKVTKSSAHHRYQLIKLLEETALNNNSLSGLKIQKSGRYQPGFTGGIANLSRKGSGSYIATDSNGLLDFDKTFKFLQLSMQLVDEAVSESSIEG